MPPTTAAAAAAHAEAEQIAELGAIGYVAGSRPARDSERIPLHDSERAAPGLNLLTSGHGPVALLMDMNGAILHEWGAELADVFPDHPKIGRETLSRRNYWRDARLLPSGDLLVLWEFVGLFKLDRDSKVIWALPESVHHALRITDTGEIVHLQAERRTLREIRGGRAIDDFIVVRDSGGRELRRLAMSDALRNVNWPRLRKGFWKRNRERGYGTDERSRFDPFHTNALWLLTPGEAARLGTPFRAGDALVSMAMLDAVAILDLEKGATRWSQQGPFGMPHEPRVTPEGEIVVFNNFHSSERSSVLTLDPRSRRVIREYMGPESAPLYSRRSGRVQVLPNGNTLVVETDGGRALEVTEDETIVWEFHSPFRLPASPDIVAGLYSLERLEPGRAPWLASRAGRSPAPR